MRVSGGGIKWGSGEGAWGASPSSAQLNFGHFSYSGERPTGDTLAPPPRQEGGKEGLLQIFGGLGTMAPAFWVLRREARAISIYLGTARGVAAPPQKNGRSQEGGGLRGRAGRAPRSSCFKKEGLLQIFGGLGTMAPAFWVLRCEARAISYANQSFDRFLDHSCNTFVRRTATHKHTTVSHVLISDSARFASIPTPPAPAAAVA